MTAALEVSVKRKVHPGLSLDVGFALGPDRGILFGPSGAGKTTILRLIAGLATPDSGTIRLGDTVLFDSARRINIPLRARGVGLVFQDDLLFPHLSAADNIKFGLKGRPGPEVAARLAEVAALCGVSNLLGRRPEALSGGERQRVGLARALAPRPRLLLCDEPVSALDLAGRHALIDRLRAVQEAEGVPVVYVTHSPAEALALGQRLFLLDGGRVVAEGPPIDVLAGAAGRGRGVLDGLRNGFTGVVEAGPSVRLDGGGPSLWVPDPGRPAGTRVVVEVLAEEILLAVGGVEGLRVSARNLIEGVVERVVPHGTDAEVFVRTGGVCWVASVVDRAVESLGLAEGVAVRLVIKARSCRVRPADAESSG